MKKIQKNVPPSVPSSDQQEYLSAYLARCGLGSRRATIELIKKGAVQVNGVSITTPAHKVGHADKVTYRGKAVKPAPYIYIALNKPAGYVTSLSDEAGRATVRELLPHKERLFPIGRLDVNTTGILLFTNDGLCAQTLSHPAYEIAKKYLVTLDKPLTPSDAQQLTTGVKLADGPIAADSVELPRQRLSGAQACRASITIHSGRNRIVRRMFTALGYRVRSLDRIGFAGITHKGLARGAWRALTKREIVRLTRAQQDSCADDGCSNERCPNERVPSVASAQQKSP